MTKFMTILLIVLALALITVSAFSEPSPKRIEAMNILWKAYTQYRQEGLLDEAEKGVNKALSIDPDLAYANIVKGELSMISEQWETAKKYFERGLSLLNQPDQPLSPVKSVQITPREVGGDTRCFLGYVYIKLAQQANMEGRTNIEQIYLEKAYESLQAGLALEPEEEAREFAQKLLKMFK